MVCVLSSVYAHRCVGACVHVHVDARGQFRSLCFFFFNHSLPYYGLLVKGLGFFEEIDGPTDEARQ